MSTVAGLDLSSHAIDLVLLDETTNNATWHHTPLPHDPLGRLLEMPNHIPGPGWFEDHGVYLIAIETPRSRFIKSLQSLLPIYGAILASLPSGIEVWAFTPGEIKREFTGNGAATKDQTKARCLELGFGDAPDMAQDAYDAYACAFVARAINQRALAKRAA